MLGGWHRIAFHDINLARAVERGVATDVRAEEGGHVAAGAGFVNSSQEAYVRASAVEPHLSLPMPDLILGVLACISELEDL